MEVEKSRTRGLIRRDLMFSPLKNARMRERENARTREREKMINFIFVPLYAEQMGNFNNNLLDVITAHSSGLYIRDTRLANVNLHVHALVEVNINQL